MREPHVLRTERSSRQRWAAIAAAAAVAVGGGAFAMVTAEGETVSSFVPISPCRLLDTRAAFNVGPRNTPIGAAESLEVDVWGSNGECVIPSTATAIVINVTATNPTANSFMTVYPADVSLPTASNLNFVANQSSTPNLVTVSLSATGAIKIFNKNGTVNVIGDIAGYYQPDSGLAIADTECSVGGLPGVMVNGVDHEHNLSSKCFTGLVSTLAGGPGFGDDDYPSNAPTFNNPSGVAVDSIGNVYVADEANGSIRKITRTGVVKTLASGLSTPQAVAVDDAGNVYVAELGNHRILKITSLGSVSAFAGAGGTGFQNGAAGSARFATPSGVAVDSEGNVYVADLGNHRIRKISGGQVTTLAGSGTSGWVDGAAGDAQFNEPFGIAVDGDFVYVGDFSNHRIRKVALDDGAVTTLAGSGTGGFLDATGAAAQFFQPAGVAVDANGNVFVADVSNERIRKITPGGVVTTIAGTGVAGYADGLGDVAQFSTPFGVAVDGAGTLYVADKLSHRIRRIN